MAATSFDSRLNLQLERNHQHHGSLVEEIEGLIKVYKDGHVERAPIVPNAPCSPQLGGVTAKDVTLNKFTNLWARVYAPDNRPQKLPLLIYFHGGGFCVGTASWSCYHDFLANLASTASCVIMSVNYRLAPENRLPAGYEDGLNAIMWVKQQAINSPNEQNWWLTKCNLSSMFLAGDSAGANIAHNLTTRLQLSCLNPLYIKGLVLIQPFFGGEKRTGSEKCSTQGLKSALSLSASDTYWRLALPGGANRDHPWCNPSLTELGDSRVPCCMVCISDMDILRDRNLEFCAKMVSAGKKVEKVVYKGVGHAFQVLDHSPHSQARTREMMSHIQAFINQSM